MDGLYGERDMRSYVGNTGFLWERSITTRKTVLSGDISKRIESDNSLAVEDGTWYSEGEVTLASNTAGLKLVLKFTGDAVKMSAAAGPNRGIAHVRIDGQPYPDIDLYDSSYERRDYTLAYSLSDELHTIKVSVSGNRRLESDDNFVVIDAFFTGN